ncbi:MAG: hypothetical protein QXJ75_03590 [Candidatus Bathyarchaeia archaeon]
MIPEATSDIKEITIIDATIKEMGSAQLKIPIINNDPSKGHNYTVTFQTDPSLSVYVGDTLLPRRDNSFSHTFYLDSGDSATKSYIIRVGILPETTTSVSFKIAVSVYLDDESEPIAKKNVEITVKKQ